MSASRPIAALNLSLFLVFTSIGCSRQEWTKCVVEVSPGNYLDVQKSDDGVTAQLVVPHQGRSISWKGTDIPISLRLRDERFYLIGYDQSAEIAHRKAIAKIGEAKLPKLIHFYAHDGDSFVPISRDKYPPELAYQNMWYQDSEVEALRDCDIKSPALINSLVPLIWADILDAYPEESPVVDQEILSRFVELYTLEKLTFSHIDGIGK